MTLYDEVLRIMEEELPEIGPYMLKKQLKDLGIDKEEIEVEDIPRISRALSEASAMFGKERSKEIARRIEKVSKVSTAIKSEKNPVKKLDMLMEMAKSRYMTGESEEAVKLFEEALELSKKSNSPKLTAEIKRYIGNINIRFGNFEAAERAFKEAEKISKSIFDKRGLADALQGFGSLEWRRGEYRKSVKYLEKVRRTSEELGDDDMVGKAYMGLANVSDEMGNQEKAIYYSELALKYLESADDKRGLVTMYNNLGVTYARQGDANADSKAYEKSGEYYEKCINLANKLDYLVMEGWASFNMAETLAKMGEFEKSLIYAGHSEEIFRKMNDKLGLSGAFMSFAILYREKGDYEKAKEYFEKTIDLRKELKTPYRIADALYEYGLMLKEIKDINAKKVLREASKIFEEIGNEERAEKAADALTGARGI